MVDYNFDPLNQMNIEYKINCKTGTSNNKFFNCLYINIGSLQNKLLCLETLIQSHSCRTDAVIVTETWLHSDIIDYYNIDGYILTFIIQGILVVVVALYTFITQ